MLRGNASKNSTYLRLMNNLIKASAVHPKKHGIRMQAHHIISADGVKLARIGEKLEEFGYDINLGANLAFLPSTLQSACHLGIQPHRGNHTAISDRGRSLDDEEDDYDDDDHPFSYHQMIAGRLKRLKTPLNRVCTGMDDPTRTMLKEEMDKLSAEVLKDIQLRPNMARLTSIADHFRSGNTIGCGGVDAVDKHNTAHSCPTHRDHAMKQGPGQRKEQITYKNQLPYVLKPGA